MQRKHPIEIKPAKELPKWVSHRCIEHGGSSLQNLMGGLSQHMGGAWEKLKMVFLQNIGKIFEKYM